MSENNVIFKVSITPGADTTERDIFNTITAFGYGGVPSTGALQNAGIKRLLVAHHSSVGATYKLYYSPDGGVNFYEDADLAQSPAAGISQVDFKIEQHAGRDLKITHTNASASAPSPFNLSVIGITDRVVAA